MAAAEETAAAGTAAARALDPASSPDSGDCPAVAAPGTLGLTDLPGELLELILCCRSLGAADLGHVACTCRRLRELCQGGGNVWRRQFRERNMPGAKVTAAILKELLLCWA